jgi:YgiT-type zinc finger domain-containing protein
MSDFGYRCEHCDGKVRPKRVKREAFKHKLRFVILEDVTIGVCDSCGSRFYSADSLKRVQEVATGAVAPERFDEIPVAHAR